MSKVLAELGVNDLPETAVKLIFFDIDGTLLDREGGYGAALKSAIRRVQAKGIKTAIASGRPHFAARFLIDDLLLQSPGVFCTGAHVYDPVTHHVLHAATIAKSLVEQLTCEVRRLGIYYELYTENNFYVEREFASEIRNTHAQHLRCHPLFKNFDEVIAAEPIYKLLIGADQTRDAASLQYLETKFPQLIFAYAGLPAHPQWLFASIIDRRADKLAAFNLLLGHHNISAENVMSFGDAQSDMVFIQAAGVGVAMGNATSAVKAVANYVTKPVWEDGIAYALQRLIP